MQSTPAPQPKKPQGTTRIIKTNGEHILVYSQESKPQFYGAIEV